MRHARGCKGCGWLTDMESLLKMLDMGLTVDEAKTVLVLACFLDTPAGESVLRKRNAA